MSREKIIIIFIVLVLLSILGSLFWFSRGGDLPSGAPVAESPIDSDVAPAALGAEYIELLKSLSAVQLDIGFFSDPVFSGMEDNSTILESKPTGRLNPFLPLNL